MQIPFAGGHDSLLFADFSGRGYAQELLVKDRYTSFWGYGADFQLLWSKLNVNPGHYPMNYDMDGDGRAEIAIATSGDVVLLSDAGKVLFRKKMTHCQHALIGKFRPDLPGKQVCFIDRLNQKPGEPFRFSDVSVFTMSGERRWHNTENFWWMGGCVVDNWTGNPNENLVGLYSRGFDPPALVGGHGREVARFPFPAAIVERGTGPPGKDRYDDYCSIKVGLTEHYPLQIHRHGRKIRLQTQLPYPPIARPAQPVPPHQLENRSRVWTDYGVSLFSCQGAG